jgi:hypothetical protein
MVMRSSLGRENPTMCWLLCDEMKLSGPHPVYAVAIGAAVDVDTICVVVVEVFLTTIVGNWVVVLFSVTVVITRAGISVAVKVWLRVLVAMSVGVGAIVVMVVLRAVLVFIFEV